MAKKSKLMNPMRPPVRKGYPPSKGPPGIPTLYTPELGLEICTRIAAGESLRGITEAPEMPTIQTVLNWVFRNEGFAAQYKLAREMQAELMADDIMEIADDGRNDYMERLNSKGEPTGGWVKNGEAIGRSALRVESRKWVASRLLPKRWGDKTHTEITGADGKDLVPAQRIDPRSLPPEVREALREALVAAMKAREGATDIEFTEEEGK
jgi:hypothetical protein